MDITDLYSRLTAAELVIFGWQVALFFITLAILIMFGRTQLSLITTYLFTLFWAFYFYWGSYIASNASLIPLVVYAFCGVLHVVLTVVAFYQEGKKSSVPKGRIED